MAINGLQATPAYTAAMRVKLGSVAFFKAAGYGIGLDDDGHLIEFLGDWRELEALENALVGPEPVYLEVEDWAIIAIDDKVRIPLTPEGARVPKVRFGACSGHGNMDDHQRESPQMTWSGGEMRSEAGASSRCV